MKIPAANRTGSRKMSAAGLQWHSSGSQGLLLREQPTICIEFTGNCADNLAPAFAYFDEAEMLDHFPNGSLLQPHGNPLIELRSGDRQLYSEGS